MLALLCLLLSVILQVVEVGSGRLGRVMEEVVQGEFGEIVSRQLQRANRVSNHHYSPSPKNAIIPTLYTNPVNSVPNIFALDSNHYLILILCCQGCWWLCA